MEPGSAWTALAFVLGVAGGGALVAWRRGRSVLAGRLCPDCGESLSPLRGLPLLSWMAVRPRCRRCGRPTPRLPAFLEAGVVAIGAGAILLTPLRYAVFWAAGGWVLLLGAIVWSRSR